VHADAKAQVPVVGCLGRRVGKFGLHLERCRHRPSGRIEHGQHRIAGSVDDASLVGNGATSSAVRVANSSAAIRREYPAASAARMAARR
jgi:hypothetical protein